MITKEKNEVKINDVLASGKTNKQDFPEFSGGGLPAATTQDLSHLFFESPTSRPDGIFQPLLFGVAKLLQEKGVSQENLKSALLIFTVINSPKLGYPLSLQLMPEDPLLAISLLDHCVSLAPVDSTIEFQKLKPEHLFINTGSTYQNRCIVCPDSNGFSKVIADIKLLLTRGHSTRQEIVTKKYDIGLVEYKAQWPISFIGVAAGKKGSDLNHPAILKVPVKANPNLTEQNLPALTGVRNGAIVPILRNRKAFERLKHRPVEIPFANLLFSSLVSAGGDHIDIKMTILVKMISICSIINQPEPVTNEEIGAYIYKTDIETVRMWLSRGSESQVGSNDGSPLIATKVDYFLAKLLLNDLLTTRNIYLNERQQRIYETLRRINMVKLSTSFIKKEDNIEILANISRHSGYWAAREKVFEEVNNDGGKDLSLSIVNNELVELMDMGILDRSKPPKSRHFGYYVMTLDLGGSISLPNPSDISDPVFIGAPVDVVNPLTGQTEKI
jgi:hypothetical protein